MNTSIILDAIKGPEFWMAIAFCIVALLSLKPLGRILGTWGQKRASEIETRINEAKALREKAEALLSEYEKRTQNVAQERDQLIQNTEKEVVSMQMEAEERLREQIRNKRQDVQERLDLVEKNGKQQIQNELTQMIVQKASSLLSEKQGELNQEEHLDQLLTQVCQTLENNMDKVRVSR